MLTVPYKTALVKNGYTKADFGLSLENFAAFYFQYIEGLFWTINIFNPLPT